MNAGLSDFERDLKRLRPRDVSAGTRDRIGRRLTRRRVMASAVAALAAVGCVILAVLILGPAGDSENEGRTVEDARIVSTMPGTWSDDSLPALGVYRRAAERSAEALDELLTRHASELLRPTDESRYAIWFRGQADLNPHGGAEDHGV